MLSKEGIINLSINRPKPKIAVYFLIHKKEIIYIGSCKDVDKRIDNHFRNKFVIFNKYTYIKCDTIDIAKDKERDYIIKFTPIYNIKDNPKAEMERQKAIALSGIKGKHIQWKKVEEVFKKHNLELIHKRIES